MLAPHTLERMRPRALPEAWGGPRALGRPPLSVPLPVARPGPAFSPVPALFSGASAPCCLKSCLC